MSYREDIAADLAKQPSRATEKGALWQRICEAYDLGGEDAVALIIGKEVEVFSRQANDIIEKLEQEL